MARTLKSCLGVISLVALLLISGYGTAEAVKAHSDGGCNACHRMPGANPRTINSLCLACHMSTGSAAAQAAGVFSQAAASNAFNHNATGTGAGSQTSHFWGGSKTAYPPAGSQDPPTTFYSSRALVSTGLVTCSICHDPHVDMATSTKLLRKTTATSDLNDAICKQCHVAYYIDNPSAVLTHPVGPFAVPTVDSLKFNAPVVNIASGNIQFFNGSVSCSSCHSTHFADSNSTTVDGKGRVLAAGDGKLLRTDGPQVTDPDPQIQADRRSAVCTACHPYKTHGNATEALSCFVCHSVHNSAAASNVFVLRSSVTTATYGTVTGISYTTVPPFNLTGSTSWADTGATTNGYCEKCHGNLLNSNPGGISESRPHIEGENCRTCHVHHKADATRSFAAGGCDGCHGYPPSANVVGGPNGYAAGYTPFKDESVTPHAAHAAGLGKYAFSCSSCHLNNNHNSASSFQDVFLGVDAPLATGNGNMAPTYTATGSGTCANVYCHSNGGARTSDAARTYTAASIPVWTAGSSTGAITTCNACHDNSGAMARNSAAHAAHIAKGYTCNVCHKDTAANNSTLATGAIGGKHVDGSRDIVFNTAYSLGAANLITAAYPDSNAGTCAVYCHSNGTTLAAADWDLPASGDCGACHKYNLNSDATQDGSGPSLDATHQTHIFDATGPKLACTICHTHDGSNVHANAGDHVNGATSYVSNYQTAVCNPCHGASNGVTTGDDRQPVWANTASVDCQTCHTGSAIAVISGRGGLNSFVDQKEYATGHGKVGVIQICANCHDTAAAGHFDGDGADRLKVDPKGDAGGEVYTVSANAWCQDCHAATKNIHYGTATTCAVCHEPHGKGMAALGNTAAMLVKGKGFINKAARDSYINPTPLFDGVCQVCHLAGTVNNFNTTTDANLTHYPGQTCTDCHKHDSTTAFAPSGCSSCHGDVSGNFWPDGSAYPDRLGSHALHIDKIATQNFGVSPTLAQKNSTCNWCHPGGGHSGDQLSAPADLMDGSASKFKNILGAVNVQSSSVAQNAGDVSCSNVDCHYSKVTVSTDWYTAGSQANCNYCHTVVDAPYLAGSLPDAHDKHMQEAGDGGRNLVCTNCHTTAAVNSHQNGVIGFSTAVAPLETVLSIDTATTSGSKLGPKYNAGAASTEFSSCSNLICHGNFTGGNNAAPNWYKTDSRIVGDNNDDGACGTCHGIDIAATPTSNAHNEHMSAGYTGATCTDCHTAATASTHVDKSINIDTGKATYSLAVAGAAPINGAQNGTCQTSGCHNQSNQSAVWNTPGDLTCNSCHGDATAGLSPSHGDHITAGKACSTCHTVLATTAHINDKTGGLVDGATVTAGEALVTITGSTTYTYTSPTCTNNGASPNNGLGCHATGTPSWGTVIAATACTACHTNTTTSAVNPTSGLHGVTPSVTGVTHDDSFGVGGTCASCHSNVMAQSTHIAGTFTGNGSIAGDRTAMGLATFYTNSGTDNTGTCATTSCHSGRDDWAHKWMATANYTSATVSCAGCHGDWTNGWNSGIVHKTSAGTNSKHGTGTTYDCKDCHNLEGTGYTFTFGTNDWSGTSSHGNGTLTINSNGTDYKEHGAVAPTTDDGLCYTCHKSQDGIRNFLDTGWALSLTSGTAITITCGECHSGGVTPGSAFGAHTIHNAGTAALVAGGAACSTCHGDNGGLGYQNTLAGTHGNSSVNFVSVTYSTAIRNDLTGTCLTAGCHNVNTGLDQSTAWDSTALACDDCHYYAATTTPTAAGNTGHGRPLSADHGNHFGTGGSFACADCHGADPVAGDTAHINGVTTLADKAVATQDEANVTVTTWNDVANTCANAACHNPSGTTYAATWQTSIVSCVLCHGDSTTKPTSGSHGQHLNAATTFGINTIACTSCHGTAPVSNAHRNATVDLLAGMTYTVGAQDVGGTLGSCTTSTCHNNGTAAATAVVTPAWGTASADCTICHGNAPATGEHAKHFANTTYVDGGCVDCHTAANTTTHINSTRNISGQITDMDLVTVGNQLTAPGGWAGTCLNNCHIANTTSDWTAGTNTLACADCHGSGKVTIPALDRGWPPTSGAHNAHVGNFYVAANCVDCHNNNTVTHSTLNNVVTLATGIKLTVNPGNGSCTNTCHLAAQALDWTGGSAAVTCVDCHTSGKIGTAPTSGLHAGTLITSANTHDDSFNDGVTAGAANCVSCHTSTPTTQVADHINGTFTSSWNAVAPSINFNTSVGFTDGTTPTCGPNGVGYVTCHDDGGAWKRKWSTTATINDGTRCANCHGDFTAGFVTGMSLRHQTATGDPNLGVANNHADAGGTLKCYICHGYGDASYLAGMHRDNSIQINTNVKVVDNGTTLGCTGCHSNDNVLTTDGNHGFDDVVQVYGRWTLAPIAGPVADCNSCHTSNGMTHLGANESVTVHDLHNNSTLLGAVVCIDCHTNAGSGADHNTGTVNFGNKLANTINYAKLANYGGTCAAASNGCHDSDAGEWIANSLGADACADCHATAAGTMGLLTGRIYPPTSAKHTKHIANNIEVPNDCADCHGTGAATGAHVTHKSGAIDDTVTYVSGTQTCTNSCHLSTTTGDWTAGGSLVCTDCHTATGKSLFTGALWPPNTGVNKHPQHLDVFTPTYGDTVNHSTAAQYDYGCGTCHGNTATNHVNGTVNVTVANWTAAAKTCGQNSCHQDGNAGPPLVTADWDAAAPTQNCNLCHGNSPSTAAHSIHTVGIHYADIYTGTTGRATSGNTTSSAHGNTATSTTINCNLCHSTAMTVYYNAANTICASCHSDTNTLATGNENAVIADKSVHVNGTPNVVFANVLVKSKAQARNFTATVPELNNTWTRTGGYKVAGAYDAAKTSLTGGSWNGTSCSTVSCHNGIAVTWATPTSDCTKCHTALP